MPSCAMFQVLKLAAFAMVPLQVSGEWISNTWITGYWDCCKPSCSWPNKGNVNQPAAACDVGTGLKLANPNVDSVCDGGAAAPCSDNQPFVVNDGLSMGFAAAAVGGVSGLNGDANCGQCYELRFTDQVHYSDGWPWGGAHPDLVGKTHIVQVTNIGYDVSGVHSFDLQIPAAGQGAFTSGCTRQFAGYSSSDFDCGTNYGGCSDISGCARLPTELQSACELRFTWFKWLMNNGQTNNPYVEFRRIKCPTELTSISGSIPDDDDEYPYINPIDYASMNTLVSTTSPSATTNIAATTSEVITTRLATTSPEVTTTSASKMTSETTTSPATTIIPEVTTTPGTTATRDMSTTPELTTTATATIGTCSFWCAGNANEWSSKCWWSQCRGCSECDGIATTTFNPERHSWCPNDGNTWESKCMWSNCRACAECDFSTTSEVTTTRIATTSPEDNPVTTPAVTPTPVATPAPDMSTTPETTTIPAATSSAAVGTCKFWCADNGNEWSSKCWWSQCRGCAECDGIATTTFNPECRSWCPNDGNTWASKCMWSNCRACAECDLSSTTTLV